MEAFNFTGLIIGAVTLFVIALSRYVCIKAEYYFSKKLWIAFLFIGLISIALSLFIDNFIISTSLGVLGFSFLWGIGEIIEQEERVKKGWFPKNPKK